MLTATLPGSLTVLGMARAAGRKVIHLRCDRSLPFEFVSQFLNGFMSIWNARHQLSISDYDPALSSAWAAAAGFDVHILWLDWRLYADQMTPLQATEWLAGQVRELRARATTARAILVNNWPESSSPAEPTIDARWTDGLNVGLQKISEDLPGLHLIDLAAVARTLGSTSFFDARNDQVSHYPFSGRASVAIARHLALQLLPALLLPPIKVIALDLDETLYSGVLGEEGWERVTLSEGHRALHGCLKQLNASGILLAICSSNEISDVEALFRRRADFPLRREDFVTVRANWDSKASNLWEIASEIRIDPSAMIFVDDNPAELVKISASLPEVQLIRASADGAETASMLTYHPGLFNLGEDEAAATRADDIRANRIREEIRASTDVGSYLADLGMVVTLYENQSPHAKRLHDLSQKTNQFNLAFARLSALQADASMGTGYFTLTVALKDRLSDSGLIGALVFKTRGDIAEAVEVIFSCRALGRDVETLALKYALSRLQQMGFRRVRFMVREGPRNKPAIGWAQRLNIAPNQEMSTRELLERVVGSTENHPAKILVQ